MEGKHIAVWFSCGVASAVAAKITIEMYGEKNRISIVNNPIKEEHPDNRRFLADVERWLNRPISYGISPRYPDQSCESVWEYRQYMSGVSGAVCTHELKKRVRQEWERIHKPDYTVLGFTAEEKRRADRFRETERDTLLTPLINLNLSKQDCFDIVMAEGIPLPEIYHYGFPNANCIGCVKSKSVTYWNLVRKHFPDVFKRRADQSREIGVKLVEYKQKRIFLDELPPDAKGYKLKQYDIECGVFCEEKDYE